MILGSMREVFLSRAKDIFLFDCRIAGWDSQTASMYNVVLCSFIRFTGDIQVMQLTPDHVRLYIANLADGPNEGDDHDRAVISQYAMIQMWIHWIYSQRLVIERTSEIVKDLHLGDLFPMQFARRLPIAI